VHDPRAEGGADGLEAQADAEHRDAGMGEAAHGLHRGARGFGTPGTRRDDQGRRPALQKLLGAGRVVAAYVHFGTELAEVLHEIEGEGIVVVDQEQVHGGLETAKPRGFDEPEGFPVTVRA
jgi:hypothetical protein